MAWHSIGARRQIASSPRMTPADDFFIWRRRHGLWPRRAIGHRPLGRRYRQANGAVSYAGQRGVRDADGIVDT